MAKGDYYNRVITFWDSVKKNLQFVIFILVLLDNIKTNH